MNESDTTSTFRDDFANYWYRMYWDSDGRLRVYEIEGMGWF